MSSLKPIDCALVPMLSQVSGALALFYKEGRVLLIVESYEVVDWETFLEAEERIRTELHITVSLEPLFKKSKGQLSQYYPKWIRLV